MKQFGFVAFGYFLLLILATLATLYHQFGVYPDYISLSERVAVLTLVVTLVGFGMAISTGWFAAQQFILAQLKPHLMVTFAQDQNSFVIRQFDIPREAGLEFFVKNLGEGVGKNVLLFIEFPSELDISIEQGEYTAAWQMDYNIVRHYSTAVFQGGDSLVLYKDFPVSVGKLRVSVGPSLELQVYVIRWRILAENMNVQEGVLQLQITGEPKS